MNTQNTTRARKGKRARRGAALPTALLLLLFMGIFGAGLLNLVGTSLRMAQRSDDATEALNMADGGLDLAMSWFSQQDGPPDGADVLFPAGNQFFGTNGIMPHPFSATDDGSSLKVRITWDVSNTGAVQKHYVVESTGTTASGATATVRAYVQQSSFGKYAVFLDSTPPNAYWASGSNVFDGPVHSNNSDNAGNPGGALNNVVWGDGSGGITPHPVFTYQGNDAFTVSGPSINWMRNGYGNYSAPRSEAEWRMIASGGSGSVQTGVPPVAMPASSFSRQYAALGQPVPPPPGDTTAPGGLPNTFGVSVPHSGGNGGPATGGLYINGPVQQMNLSVDPGNSTTQIIQVKQTDASGNPYTTTVTLNASTNTTSVHVDYLQQSDNSGNFHPVSTDTSYTGVTNGVVYCAGNVGATDPNTENRNDPNTQQLVSNPASGGVTGVVADGRALTLATDTAHNVNIDGNLTYKTPRQTDGSGNLLPESDPANAAFRAQAGTLGIVSRDVVVVDKDASGNPIINEEVDAAVMAFGTYDAADYFNRPVGKMLNMGTYIVKNRGLFNVGNGLNVVSGIPCSRLYDNRLADHPPPFFPTTSSHYDIVSWQRVVTPLP